MARLPRLIVPGQPHHLIQRGAGAQAVFLDEHDYLTFLMHLRDGARRFGVDLHAYVLMPDHLHLLATPTDATGLARCMQWLGRHYVPYFNRKYQRSGTIWQGRYKTAVIESQRYFLLCSRYIELNPVRAGLVAAAADYRWSSYRHHVGAAPDALITEHPLYWALGNTPFAREAAYRDLVAQSLPANDVAALTEATLKGWAIGSDRFKNDLEKQVRQRVQPMKAGRPAIVRSA
jgi:putative transposase